MISFLKNDYFTINIFWNKTNKFYLKSIFVAAVKVTVTY